MNLSVIVPLYNEEESLPELFSWIKKVAEANAYSFEVIFVDDGSTDSSWTVIEDICKNNPEAKGIKFRRNYGKSPALYCGFKQAQGDVVVTMDADLQDSPDEIPALYKMVTEDGCAYEKPAEQAFQRDGAQGFGHKASRLQLRFEGLQERGSEKHRGLRRNAQIYSLSCEERRFFQDRGEGSAPSGA